MGYKKWARVSSFKNIGDEDIENNFVGAFPSNHRNKFINHKLMISEKKKENILLQLLIQMSLARAERIDGAYSTLNQSRHFFFDSFGIDGLKNFIIQEARKAKKLIWNQANDQDW